MWRWIFAWPVIACLIVVMFVSRHDDVLSSGTTQCHLDDQGLKSISFDDQNRLTAAELEVLGCEGSLADASANLQQAWYEWDGTQPIGVIDAAVHRKPVPCAVELHRISVWTGFRWTLDTQLAVSRCSA